MQKAALQAFKHPLCEIESSDAIKSVLDMKPKDFRQPASVALLRIVLKDPQVLAAVESSEDVHHRGAFKHFASRIPALAELGFVPNADDLLHLNMPTIGNQETKVNASPVGALTLVEVGVNLRSSIFDPPGYLGRAEVEPHLFGGVPRPAVVSDPALGGETLQALCAKGV